MPINDPQALAPPLREACIAWLAAGNGAFWIVSGVRTYDEQVALYQAYLNGTGNLAAVPGTSRHERGLAVDIGGDKALAARLAPRFGLGQTVRGEDWHYEVVNEAIASTYPKEEGFTVAEIEQLINVIQAQGKLTRKAVRKQALLGRLQAAKFAKADQKDLDAILAELKALGSDED